MGTRFRMLGIAFSVLLVFFLLPSARADEVTFTFTPATGNPIAAEFSTCLAAGTCLDFGSGTFTLGPPQDNQFYYGASPITGMTGTLDGSAGMFLVLQGYPAIAGTTISPAPNNFPIVFAADAQVWGLWRNDLGGWSNFLINYTTNTEEPINLTVTAPEPSTLLFLGIGLLGLMGLTLLKNRLN